jgi:hypothetical protein
VSIRNDLSELERARREHQALAILLAARASNGSTNDHVLGTYLDRIALGGSNATIQTAMRALEAAGALRLAEADDYLVATLTETGERAAEGKTTLDGVARLLRES